MRTDPTTPISPRGAYCPFNSYNRTYMHGMEDRWCFHCKDVVGFYDTLVYIPATPFQDERTWGGHNYHRGCFEQLFCYTQLPLPLHI